MKNLTFDQYLKISEIADKIELKSYQEYLERKLVKVEKDKLNNEYKCNKEDLTENQKNELSKEKQLSLVVDVALYVSTKAWKVRNELVELFILDGMKEEEVLTMRGENIFIRLKEMFATGLPDIFKNKFEDLKKTL